MKTPTLALLLVVPALAPAADPPVTRLYTASDLPRLAEGVRLPRGGGYAVRVWSGPETTWSLETDGQTLAPASPE